MPAELMAVILGLLAAASFGAGDFVGGLNSKRNSVLMVTFCSQVAGWLFYVICALLTREAMPPAQDLIFAALAGIIGVIAIATLYWVLSLGQMGIAAPIAGILTAAVPVIVGISTQGLPETLTLIGFGVGFVAVWLVAATAGGSGVERRVALLAMVSGTAAGLCFVFFARATENATFIPLIVSRSTTITIMLLIGLIMRRRVLPTHTRTLGLIALGGVLDALGNLFFVSAVQADRLDIASVITSLYPAMTVLLAWAILKERLRPLQWVGVGAALVAIALIAA